MSTITVSPFLSMNGQAKEAIDFYVKYLDAKVLFLTTNQEIKNQDSSYQYPEGEDDYISHSVLQIGETQLMIADEIMSSKKDFILGTNFSLCILSNSENEIVKLYERLTEDPRTKIVIPLAPNSFANAYAIVEDPFGTTIQLGNEKELDS